MLSGKQALAATFYPAQTDGKPLFEVKFKVTAAGLVKTRPIVCKHSSRRNQTSLIKIDSNRF